MGWATGLVVEVGKGLAVGALVDLTMAVKVGLGGSAVKVEVGINGVADAGAVTATAVALGTTVETAGAGKVAGCVGSSVNWIETLHANDRVSNPMRKKFL